MSGECPNSDAIVSWQHATGDDRFIARKDANQVPITVNLNPSQAGFQFSDIQSLDWARQPFARNASWVFPTPIASNWLITGRARCSPGPRQFSFNGVIWVWFKPEEPAGSCVRDSVFVWGLRCDRIWVELNAIPGAESWSPQGFNYQKLGETGCGTCLMSVAGPSGVLFERQFSGVCPKIDISCSDGECPPGFCKCRCPTCPGGYCCCKDTRVRGG